MGWFFKKRKEETKKDEKAEILTKQEASVEEQPETCEPAPMQSEPDIETITGRADVFEEQSSEELSEDIEPQEEQIEVVEVEQEQLSIDTEAPDDNVPHVAHFSQADKLEEDEQTAYEEPTENDTEITEDAQAEQVAEEQIKAEKGGEKIRIAIARRRK